MSDTLNAYVNAVADQRDALADSLQMMGVEASRSEKLNTLVPKVRSIRGGIEQVNADWDAVDGVAEILNKPNTIAGYGITDAYTKTEIDAAIQDFDVAEEMTTAEYEALSQQQKMDGTTRYITDMTNGFPTDWSEIVNKPPIVYSNGNIVGTGNGKFTGSLTIGEGTADSVTITPTQLQALLTFASMANANEVQF